MPRPAKGTAHADVSAMIMASFFVARFRVGVVDVVSPEACTRRFAIQRAKSSPTSEMVQGTGKPEPRVGRISETHVPERKC